MTEAILIMLFGEEILSFLNAHSELITILISAAVVLFLAAYSLSGGDHASEPFFLPSVILAVMSRSPMKSHELSMRSSAANPSITIIDVMADIRIFSSQLHNPNPSR
jgi:hypothetical protein